VTPNIEFDAIGHKCARDLDIIYESKVPPMLLICNMHSPISLSFTEPLFLLFYGYMALQGFILLGYCIYRMIRKRTNITKAYKQFDDSQATLNETKSEFVDRLEFSGYKMDAFGSVV
jgi:hypothetical protein